MICDLPWTVKVVVVDAIAQVAECDPKDVQEEVSLRSLFKNHADATFEVDLLDMIQRTLEGLEGIGSGDLVNEVFLRRQFSNTKLSIGQISHRILSKISEKMQEQARRPA